MTKIPEKRYGLTIPPEILADNKLPPLQKLILIEIIVLSKRRGYSWALNAHFAKRFGVSRPTVSRALTEMIGNGYISAETTPIKTGTGRKLFPL